MKKKIFIIVGIILLIYILFVTIDCIRLRYSKTGTQPFITLNIKDYENGSKYIGLGYSIKYYTNTIQEYDIISVRIYGAEFRLFDKILIWAWVI